MWVNQAIDHALGISVFGSALLRAEPDLATLHLKVVRIASKPADSFHATQESADAVRRVLREGAVPDTAVQISRTTLDMAYGGHPHREFLGYRASVELRVLVEALDSVQALLAAVVDAGAHEISEVRFTTRRLKDLRAQARRQAIASARRKAETYAEEAGVQLGPVVHIEDVNPDQLTQRGHAPDIDATEHDEASDPGVLQSGSLVVTAAAMVVYAIVPGG